jgi:hypothetical protein
MLDEREKKKNVPQKISREAKTKPPDFDGLYQAVCPRPLASSGLRAL